MVQIGEWRRIASSVEHGTAPERYALLYGKPIAGSYSPVTQYSYNTDLVLIRKDTLDQIAERIRRTGGLASICLRVHLLYVENLPPIVNGDAEPLGRCVAKSGKDE